MRKNRSLKKEEVPAQPACEQSWLAVDYACMLLWRWVNKEALTLKASHRQVKPGEGWDEEQGKGRHQELPASATHSQHFSSQKLEASR